jgi:hypothetical protein
MSDPAEIGPAAPPPAGGDRYDDRSKRWRLRGNSASKSRSRSPTAGGSVGQDEEAGNNDGERRRRLALERLGPAAGGFDCGERGANPGSKEEVDGAHKHPGVELLGDRVPPSTPVSVRPPELKKAVPQPLPLQPEDCSIEGKSGSAQPLEESPSVTSPTLECFLANPGRRD